MEEQVGTLLQLCCRCLAVLTKVDIVTIYVYCIILCNVKLYYSALSFHRNSVVTASCSLVPLARFF